MNIISLTLYHLIPSIYVRISMRCYMLRLFIWILVIATILNIVFRQIFEVVEIDKFVNVTFYFIDTFFSNDNIVKFDVSVQVTIFMEVLQQWQHVFWHCNHVFMDPIHFVVRISFTPVVIPIAKFTHISSILKFYFQCSQFIIRAVKMIDQTNFVFVSDFLVSSNQLKSLNLSNVVLVFS